MDVILCHETADFDALGAAVGAARLYPGAKIVLTGGAHQSVRDFLGLHRDEYPLIELRSVNEAALHRIVLVDVQSSRRLGRAAEWLTQPGVEVHVYDHHLPPYPVDYQASVSCLEPVGATCTLMVERLRELDIELSPFEVTALALGIHVDTGSLTFGSSTARDAKALAWLMERGVNLDVISTYIDGGLSPEKQELLAQGLDQLPAVTKTISGYRVAVWTVQQAQYIKGFAGIVERLIDLTDVDVLVAIAQQKQRISIIGRSQHDFAQLQTIMRRYSGGGHARAASASFKTKDYGSLVAAMSINELNSPANSSNANGSNDGEVEKGTDFDLETLASAIEQQLKATIPHPIQAADVMSSPVRTIRPGITIDEAQRVLLRYGHSGLSVVDAGDRLVGVISRRDLDLALHHGFGHAPVKAYMSAPARTISPDTSLHEIQDLMLKWDIGRLPVLEDGEPVGIVTRTDVLRQLHDLPPTAGHSLQLRDRLQVRLQKLLTPRYLDIIQEAAITADQLDLHLYLVGGTVRDLLLNRMTDDLDLVVDGRHPRFQPDSKPAPEGWGVVLGRALQTRYPEARLEIHGKFQTVALIWPDGLWIDIATARTEFYPYPAAPPEVAASSIQQDLYRRDFTINALALRLNGPQAGDILDFFGGLEDLEQQSIRVLHPNSFIEDPTRTFRAIRFAVRLGFTLEERTRDFAQQACQLSGDRSVSQVILKQGPRIKQELTYLLTAERWWLALQQLNDLCALQYIHPKLDFSPNVCQQMRRVGSWLHHFARQYADLHRRTIWQLRLECLLLNTPNAIATAEAMDWPHDGLRRLEKMPQWLDSILPQLIDHPSPSTAARCLDALHTSDVILLAALSPATARRHLWKYLQDWRLLKAPLSGHDLKQMGYQPGPQYKIILESLRTALLDGEVFDRKGSRRWVQQQFPNTSLEKFS